MKKLICLAVATLAIGGCAQGNNSANIWDNYRSATQGNLSSMSEIMTTQRSLISSGTKDYQYLESNIKKAGAVSSDQSGQCSVLPTSNDKIDCLKSMVLINQGSAEMEIETAKYLASKGEKAKAKDVFRNVITSYPGSPYRSYAKQAEFGLEDLKQSP